MNNKKILEKVIEKAQTNSNNPRLSGHKDHIETFLRHNRYYRLIFSHEFAQAFWGERARTGYFRLGYGDTVRKTREELINEGVDESTINLIDEGGGSLWPVNTKGDALSAEWTISWQHHLQQMVLEKNPLKYLERFL